MQRRQFVTTLLGAIASGFVPLPVSGRKGRSANGFIRTNWSRDPFSFGSYSFVAKGAGKRDHKALGQPVGNRLFFAGEATHPDYNSTVHAAYESGLIAADAVSATQARTVGIIGAGISGLAAADALSGQGRAVTVLEARDRIGGRIWTDGRLGVPLDLGASWIHGTDGNPLVALADRLNLATRATSDSYVVRGGDGRRIPETQAPDWLENVVSVQHTAGADLSDINTAAYWRDHDYDGEDVVFPEGYAQLLDGLSSGFDIEPGRIVTDVTVSRDTVRLKTGGGTESLFDAVIVTVPLGVLKQGGIAFTPPLPTPKQKAIATLGMGVLDKVYLRYDDVFWDPSATWIATPENGLPRGQFNQWLNLFPYIGQPVIMAFNGAQPARDLAPLSDMEIVGRAEQTLASAYPLPG